MKRILAILPIATVLATFPCSAAPGVGDKLSISVTNKYGDVFTNLTVVQILGDGVVLEHRTGQLKLKYDDLPQEVSEAYRPLAAEITKKELEHGKASAAYAAHRRQLQAEAAHAREQNEQQKANMLVDKSIPVPDQGWNIVVLDPGLVEMQRQSSEDLFAYTATGRDGFEMTIFVQKPADDSTDNEHVFKYYWSRVNPNLSIDPNSLKAERWQNFVKVSFTTGGTPHSIFYFAFRGRWTAIHISKSPYTQANAKLFKDFDNHLSYH